jgi:hypothetical protein
MTFYNPSQVTSGLADKKKSVKIEVDPLMNLINRPQLDEESMPMRQTRELASEHWNFFMKKILQNTNVSVQSLQEAKRFVLLKQPTKDYMTKLDLIDVEPTLFRKKKKVQLTEQELEYLRIMVNTTKQS